MKPTIALLFAFYLFSSAFAEDSTNQKRSLPSVQVKTLDGKAVNIQDLGKTGRITIIFFWETYCNPSIKGLDNILDVYEEWQAKYNCDLVGVNMDDSRNISKVKPMVNGKGWPFTFLTDENKDLFRALNIPNCPYFLLLDKQGNIIYRHSGYSDGFEFELEKQIKKY